ncbi:biopolymer transporter ExbB [Loktanella sp. D2R18]|uniref:biopolymer transporter ExbB n=1 Tax=Rhodobacterales TaxID=204455 RepID=UPI000DEBC233|nr:MULTISPECIES: biopolymer transporter ExbB [Rhodobacterales]MDO6591410.1 biopolymer transporter ExbB [Yoonia sp. 1_MG-2023]RBW43574.1 biopolymer transporter ExbB [Loktanella sp. D2R18]
MLVVLGLVGAGFYLGLSQLMAIYNSNPYLNAVILTVFALGVLSCVNQVFQLMKSVGWIEHFAKETGGHNFTKAPSLLAPLATLLRSRGARTQVSSSSGRSILDSVAQRIDEDREITRYIGNVLIFLGLLGTFYGLATTVPALVDTIRSLNPGEGESGADIFNRLQAGLEAQLGGMGTAFSSSLLGLAGSLIVGLLELFAGHGQNRFYRELEEWLSTITRVGIDGEEGGGIGGLDAFADQLSELMDTMQMTIGQNDADREQTDQRFAKLAAAVEQLAHITTASSNNNVFERIAEGQEKLIKKLDDSGMEGIDAESRMRLRSIDVQMLRILEEMSAGRQEAIGDLRMDLANLASAIRERG